MAFVSFGVFAWLFSAVNVSQWQTVGGNERWTKRANEQMSQDVLAYIEAYFSFTFETTAHGINFHNELHHKNSIFEISQNFSHARPPIGFGSLPELLHFTSWIATYAQRFRWMLAKSVNHVLKTFTRHTSERNEQAKKNCLKIRHQIENDSKNTDAVHSFVEISVESNVISWLQSFANRIRKSSFFWQVKINAIAHNTHFANIEHWICR